MANISERSLEDINEILSSAKLSESDVMPTCQSVYFTPKNLHNNNYVLLELDKKLLNDISEGNTLYIKGDDDENAVICTDNRTCNMVQAETSNTLLLVEKMKFSKEIADNKERNCHQISVYSIFHEYLEVSPGNPHLKKLKDMLEKTIYKGPEHEYAINKQDLLSFEDLNKTIQSSEQDLRKALNKMDVVTINNKIRLLDFEYHFRVLSFMLKLIDENSWELDEIDYEETMKALQDLFPAEVINSLFDKYSAESKLIDGNQLYTYKEQEICKFFAQVLLHDAGKFNLEDFLQAWKDSVPEGMVPNEEMLHGIAIIDRESKPHVIWAFSETALPENIIERFKILFQTKEIWTVPEIAPYIQSLATDKLDVNALLAKYARASKVNGVKCYSAKHAK